jgi:glycosyltransferase involved in cell wall biosynthesis
VTRLRVAYVVGTTQGGTGRHVAMLARGCAQAGAAVQVFGPAEVQSVLDARTGFAEVTIADRPRPARDLAAARRLRRLLRTMAPDVVHAHGMRAGGLAVLALRPSPGVGWPGGRAPALVVTVHNAPPAIPGTAAVYAVLERLVARRSDVVLCVAADLAARMRRLGARDTGHAIVPAPPPRTASAPAPAELGSAGRPVVLGVGRLAPQKGFDTLLVAAARWRDRRPEPLVVIAGAGPLADDLAARAVRLQVDARFIGMRGDVDALLAAANVFVLPSRWEGQPLVVQEALRAGRPVVATDVGGVRELTGTDAAILVPAGDPAALADAVLRVLDDAELAATLGKAAAARAAMLPTESDATAAALALYERLSPA